MSKYCESSIVLKNEYVRSLITERLGWAERFCIFYNVCESTGETSFSHLQEHISSVEGVFVKTADEWLRSYKLMHCPSN